MNKIKNNETKLINEFLAEFFYDADIALNLMSDFYNIIILIYIYIN